MSLRRQFARYVVLDPSSENELLFLHNCCRKLSVLKDVRENQVEFAPVTPYQFSCRLQVAPRGCSVFVWTATRWSRRSIGTTTSRISGIDLVHLVVRNTHKVHWLESGVRMMSKVWSLRHRSARELVVSSLCLTPSQPHWRLLHVFDCLHLSFL